MSAQGFIHKYVTEYAAVQQNASLAFKRAVIPR
jgi:hypothetical protein